MFTNKFNQERNYKCKTLLSRKNELFNRKNMFPMCLYNTDIMYVWLYIFVYNLYRLCIYEYIYIYYVYKLQYMYIGIPCT